MQLISHIAIPEKADQLKSLLENWWKETKAPIPNKLNPEYILDN